MVEDLTTAVQLNDLRRTKRSLEFVRSLLEGAPTQGLATAKLVVDVDAWAAEFIGTVAAQIAELERPAPKAAKK